MACLFIFIAVSSFEEQIVFNFDEIQFVFSVVCAFCVLLLKSLPFKPKVTKIFLFSSVEKTTFCSFTLRFMIYLVLIFVCFVR